MISFQVYGNFTKPEFSDRVRIEVKRNDKFRI